MSTSPRVYLRPVGLHTGPDAVALVGAGLARPILGGSFAVATVELIEWRAEGLRREIVQGNGLAALDLTNFERPPPAAFDRPLVMGILNVTPDSFSDGGRHAEAEAAIGRGLQMIEEGADIVDVGGESTRPGAREIAVDEELRRVVPVVERLAQAGAYVSIDTRKAEVMREAVRAGASLINDVSGLTHDLEAMAVAISSGARVMLMHMQGEPRTMNRAPAYEHCALEVYDWLETRLRACAAAGLPRARILLDPGLCFGKHEAHNLDVLHHLALFHGLGCPLALGASRKGWTDRIESYRPPVRRLPGSLVAAQWALERGVTLLRVHDVFETRQAVDAWCALAGRLSAAGADAPAT